jgi:hypothetical protein
MAKTTNLESDSLNGISGWLAVFVIGLVLRPILLIYVLLNTYLSLANTEGIGLIVDPSSECFRGGLLILPAVELMPLSPINLGQIDRCLVRK